MKINYLILITAFFAAPMLYMKSYAKSYANLRCGNALVFIGDNTYSVIDKCGEPYALVDKGIKFLKTTSFSDDHEYEIIEKVVVEEWVYKLEKGSFTRLLMFENGSLKKVTLGRRVD